MCGPSSALKAVNKQIQDFSNQVTTEAKDVFGDASSIFGTIKGQLDKIVNAGASQLGFSAAEQSAKDAAAINTGATTARNLKAAAASSGAAIGGGNVVLPAGSTQQAVLNANATAATQTADQLNKNLQENYETGRQNFFNATQQEEALPNVFNPAVAFNNNAESAQNSAMKSQQAIDTASNWWAPMLENVAGSALGAFTGGLGGGLAKGLIGKVTGGAKTATGGWNGPSSGGSDIG